MTEQNKESLKWMWIDGKMHEVKIIDSETTKNISDLLKTSEDIIKENEDKCRNIYYLGLGITGLHDAARGFLWGWLLRSMKQPNWEIEHGEKEISEEEAKEMALEMIDELKEKIMNRGIKKNKLPIIRDTDATDIFK